MKFPRKKDQKIIFVLGGVLSSLGKGIIASSLGTLLKQRNVKVSIQKLDPYLNIDPGTMSPYEHGEVFVTEDGAETDLDLGHYERFIDSNLVQGSNMTSGSIYNNILKKEREGKYLGKTIQIIPHVTNEIKNAIYSLQKKEELDVLIVEIGGTVGDIELLPFVEAARQISLEKGYNNVCFILVTLVPYLQVTKELKTKPSQYAVHELGRLGIQPNFIVCRTEKTLPKELKQKIANFCNVNNECVFESKDVDTIYRLPKILKEQKFDEIIAKKLNMPLRKINFKKWDKFIAKVDATENSKKTLIVKLVGKYVVLHDAYLSIAESLKHATVAAGVKLQIDWIQAEDVTEDNYKQILGGASAILVPGGFGERGFEGKLLACKYARETKTPFLGICLGMQAALVEFARNVMNLKDANSTEMNPVTTNPVIDIIRGKSLSDDIGGTLRLGSYPCALKSGSIAKKVYKNSLINERHRHRYEVNNDFVEKYESAGLMFSGVYEQMNLKEIIELKNHPYYVACQFHPEYKSRPYTPHPLFIGLVDAAIAKTKFKKSS